MWYPRLGNATAPAPPSNIWAKALVMPVSSSAFRRASVNRAAASPSPNHRPGFPAVISITAVTNIRARPAASSDRWSGSSRIAVRPLPRFWKATSSRSAGRS